MVERIRQRRTRVLVVLGTLLLAATVFVSLGMQSFGAYQRAYANYATACGNQVTWSPPSVIFTALYPNQPPLFTVRFRSPEPRELRISVSIPHYSQEQTAQVLAGSTFQQRSFQPPLLASDVMDRLIGPREVRAQIRLHVQSAATTLCDITAPVVLKSRQLIRWWDPVTGDNTGYLAGWVTPQARVIQDLVGRTGAWMRTRPDLYEGATTLRGYDGGRATPQQVQQQVNAIFDTLQFVYGVHYAADNIPFSSDTEQIVQSPTDVLTSTVPTGMCVETTAILASAVERLGMRPYIVIIPGHAFLGVALGAESTARVAYWETSDLNGGIYGSQANVHGENEFAAAKRDGTILRTVDIQAQRQAGIEPIE